MSGLGRLVFDAGDSKRTKTVWRIQDSQGRGVYSSERYFDLGWRASKLSKEEYWQYLQEDLLPKPFPGIDFPGDEFDPRASKDLIFGFLKQEDAEKWFGPVTLRLLIQSGFSLVPRKAKKVFLSRSKKQVAFIPAD